MSGEKILIVEDDGIIASSLAMILTKFGYKVAGTVQTGEEAIKKAKEISPNLVLMDIHLRGNLNGIDAAVQISEDMDIPIIYLTAYSEEGLLQRAKITEPYGYLVKPVHDRELYATIEMALYKHKLEAQLKENEEWLNTTLRSIGDAVIATDEKGFIKFMNPVAEELTGWKQNEAIGLDLKEVFCIINENTRQPVQSPLEKVIQTGKTAGLANHTLLIKKDKTEIPIDDNAAPIVTGVGSSLRLEPTSLRLEPTRLEPTTLRGIVLVFRDISKSRQLEERLRQSQKMEAIGILAGGIAHDFNNILYPIVGYAEMALDDLPEESNIRTFMKEILKGAERAKDLIQQILTFSRKKEFKLSPVKIQPIIKETLKFIRASLPSNIEIQTAIKEDCGLVMADTTQIHQIIMNLCTNAYHAMREKGGVLKISLDEINISTENSDIYTGIRHGDYLKITVSDTGIGMNDKVKEKIFSPYFTTKSVGEGSGLGLSVVYGIVQEYKGEIRFQSEHDNGAIFEIFLPLLKSCKSSLITESSLPAPKGIEHILLVDDEEAITDMMQQMLRKLGYNVTARCSSLDALDIFYEKPEIFDLVITDMTMPKMTGLELAKALKKIRDNIPVILCTGYSELITEEKMKKSGICRLIMKPVSKNKMAETIRLVLEKPLVS